MHCIAFHHAENNEKNRSRWRLGVSNGSFIIIILTRSFEKILISHDDNLLFRWVACFGVSLVNVSIFPLFFTNNYENGIKNRKERTEKNIPRIKFQQVAINEHDFAIFHSNCITNYEIRNKLAASDSHKIKHSAFEENIAQGI